jgi:hypothetical protein
LFGLVEFGLLPLGPFGRGFGIFIPIIEVDPSLLPLIMLRGLFDGSNDGHLALLSFL